jgi:hypothetical protein
VSRCRRKRSKHIPDQTIKYVCRSCSSAEGSSSDTAASCRRRQRTKQRPARHDHVRATHSERRSGQRPQHPDQVPSAHKERRRGQRPGNYGQVPLTNNCRFICRVHFSCCGSVAWPQETVWPPAWASLSPTCDQSYVQRLHLVGGTSLRVLPCLCAQEADNINSASMPISRMPFS